MDFSLPALYPILDASFVPMFERSACLTRIVCELENAGVTLLQFRDKQDNHEEILSDARVIRKAATHRVKLIMNDHPEIAVRAEFDGVHVGQRDTSPAEARRIIGADGIVGISTHNRAQLEAADAMPVDYVACGPVFATASKLNPDPLIGLDGVREARSLTRKPLVAIGGITPANAGEVMAAGADSVAVISALFAPGSQVADIVRAFLIISDR